MSIPESLHLWLHCIRSDKVQMFDYLVLNTPNNLRLPDADFIDLCLHNGSYSILEAWCALQSKKKEPLSLLTPYLRQAYGSSGDKNPELITYGLSHPLLNAMLTSRIILEYILKDNAYEKVLDVVITKRHLAQPMTELIQIMVPYVNVTKGRPYASSVSNIDSFMKSSIQESMLKLPEVEESRKEWTKTQKKYTENKGDNWKWVSDFQRYYPDISFDGGYLTIFTKKMLSVENYSMYLSWLFEEDFDWEGLWNIFVTGTSYGSNDWDRVKEGVHADLAHYDIWG